ncbi:MULTISPECIES: aminotransferase class IV [unclassified Lysobacter]|uniref:aminotransferase class IV n=1 Tax=unclassified Lysobacter TaxID=2635362 RepID=UPI001BEAE81C|nr:MULTISPECIES: aminotransferase class IV [unclassified Lysobacter]MBT2746350.1 aminotransferase class IV [Lysobacter sp. ISL-42]MBT2751177.1 aminotransferase class IV [Lysobacter sp. ISL-50]MBT2775585.1 aminotransferase class IV [Lysobacter sp. ISL-54]MBT2779970.1 aminotransferase class IV [Lysobacter sp. ISL-52]
MQLNTEIANQPAATEAAHGGFAASAVRERAYAPSQIEGKSAGAGRSESHARGEVPNPANQPLIWFDGNFIAGDAPEAPLTTHAMHYGTAVFEGIRSYATADGGAAVFRLPEHMERMRKGADMFGIEFDAERATQATLATLRANGHRDAYIRPLTWMGTGSIGLDVDPLSQHLMIATMAKVVHLGGARTRLTVSPWKRNPATSMPPLKLSGAYVNSILAKREAKQRGFDEALFTDDKGYVVECTGANVFMVKNGVVTSVDHRDALPGITRDTMIELSGAQSREVTLHELLDADEVFVCGTAAEATAIAVLDRREFGDNPVTRELAALYGRVVRGQETRYASWLTAV